MNIKDYAAIIILKDAQIFRANTISKRLENPIAAIEMLLEGKELPKTFLQQVLADLEYLDFLAGSLKKAGKSDVGNSKKAVRQQQP